MTVAVVAPSSAIGKTTCRVVLTSATAPVKVISGNPPLSGTLGGGSLSITGTQPAHSNVITRITTGKITL